MKEWEGACAPPVRPSAFLRVGCLDVCAACFALGFFFLSVCVRVRACVLTNSLVWPCLQQRPKHTSMISSRLTLPRSTTSISSAAVLLTEQCAVLTRLCCSQVPIAFLARHHVLLGCSNRAPIFLRICVYPELTCSMLLPGGADGEAADWVWYYRMVLRFAMRSPVLT